MAIPVRPWKELGRLWSRAPRVLDLLAYLLQRKSRWGAKRVAAFWDRLAQPLDHQWGRGQWDFEVLGRIITDYHVRSVLDIGCGSGRLFPLFRQLAINPILGVDISPQALAIAGHNYPKIATQCARLQDLSLADDEFDLLVSNRVLQHIAPGEIGSVIAKLCKISPLIYLNELSASDQINESFWMFIHDFDRMMQEHGFVRAEQGRMGSQTYALFRRRQIPNRIE
jgi:SAM-dependent methyltransferase